MSVLEKILKEVEEKIKFAEKVMVKPPCDKLDEIANDTAEAFIEEYKECKEIIRSHMDDAENDGWIPVSERLPEENGGYLTTVKELNYEEHVTISFFDKYDMRGWQHVHMLAEKVTAWKPLPKPYKGE